ncbi:Polygalacturonase inhibitor [Morus notabilis]|uniref:Polygalacturonase inhibitor n=1 Tax=Morus notabilis TaxID=981085 RepID=W9S814_9ROSA|nr:polygalacturonase inhibitor [Morus notabilis]EXC30881.1 Polygalacturonase inhibitor [Morus notabilis]
MDDRKQIYHIICFSVLFCSFIYPCLSELCHPQDKKALLQIKKGFNNPHVFSTWDPNTDCCVNWGGAHCDEKNNRIETLEIYFGGGDLSGPIPPEIGDLPYLRILWWHKQPNLTGPIPQSITKLKRLSYLVITWANLSGPIPDFLSEIKSLVSIEFSFNNLTGPIPSSLSRLTNLTGLVLDRNKLTGPIPDSFGEFQGFSFYLKLSHNQLSGKIPASLGKKDFTYVDLSRNKLEGDASVLFGSNKKMTQQVYLSRNLFEFDLSEVEFPKSLIELDLSHNKITGSIPVGLTAVDYLQGLNVSYNRLCGKIPVGGALQGFDYTAYFHNRCLCGSPLMESCK